MLLSLEKPHCKSNTYTHTHTMWDEGTIKKGGQLVSVVRGLLLGPRTKETEQELSGPRNQQTKFRPTA